MSRSKHEEAHSPGRESGEASVQLARMMRGGRSFSGRERHCLFLSTADGAFADVSATSGIDLADDGRALAACDWDQDGDLDLWVSNRTGPQLRLLRNDGTGANRSIALRLVAAGPNRGAIGARVELALPGDEHPRVASVRAGSGFLTQASSRLHFGVGPDARGARARVRWPDGTSEDFPLEGPGSFELVQGSGEARRVPPRAVPSALDGRRLEPVEAPSNTRIHLATLPPLASVPYADSVFGQERRARPAPGRALLVNLWASWCAPCLAELREFTARADELRAARVDVLALSVDGLGDERADPAAAARILEGFPFETGRATPELIERLSFEHDAQFKLDLQLGVPTSFLIDASGRLTTIYLGPVGVEALVEDASRDPGTFEERLRRASGLPGRLIDDDLARASRLRSALRTTMQAARGHLIQGRIGAAESAFRAALELDPDCPEARDELEELLRRRAELGQGGASGREARAPGDGGR